MLVDAIQRGERPDLCVFVDVGNGNAFRDSTVPAEWEGTYRHIREVVIPLCARAGIEFVWIDSATYPVRTADSLFSWFWKTRSIPVVGDTRLCTIVAKVERFERWMTDRFPDQDVEVWIGFDAGEEGRAEKDPNAGRKRKRPPPAGSARRHNRFPLIERGLCRCRCEDLVRKAGYPIPRKSACKFCGFNSMTDWQTFDREDRAGFDLTAQLEVRHPTTANGYDLSIAGFRKVKDKDGKEIGYRAPRLPIYIQGTPRPRSEPCPVCGRAVRATKAVACDWLEEAPTAALVLAPSRSGRYAAIRSFKLGGAVGFPGGKVEPGETPEAAAVRELGEETGLVAGPLTHLGTRDDGEHVTTLYLAPTWTGSLRSSREGIAFWATQEELTGPSSAFRDFNRWAFQRLAESEAA
jgi:8-oxo-dGTP pyrophosphatase MutT (NUDIX family)